MDNKKTNIRDRIRVFFGFGNAETVRCKECKSIDIESIIIKKEGKYFKWYHCNKCGRNFWSKEVMIYKRPKWFTRTKPI